MVLQMSVKYTIFTLNTFDSFCRCVKITSVGMVQIAHLQGITSLSLYGCSKHLLDGALVHVAKLAALTSLNLCKCSMVADAGQSTSPLLAACSLWFAWC